MNAPVALFVYNRPNHTKRTIEALMKNDDALNTELFIFSDGAKDETEKENVDLVRKYIDEVKNQKCFSKVEIILQKQNQGLEESIIMGVTKLINQYGKIIVLEDDIVTAPDFLTFMNKALNAYQNDSKVWSISSYSLDTRKICKSKDDVMWTYRGECWGWASWADRWNRVDWEVKDYSYFIKNKQLQYQFNRGGRDMTSLLKKQHNHEINSWAIRWCYQQFKEGMITVFPKHPKSYNDGFDGSGTNCSEDSREKVIFVKENNWNFQYSLNNKVLLHEFQKMYAKSFWTQIVGRIWYDLTEYEYCLLYRTNKGKNNILKPNYREWYADPVPFVWNDKQYVFAEVYMKRKGKGSIGLLELQQNGELKRTKILIEEEFHLSFPSVFVVAGQVYMVPECSEARQIRIYKMMGNIYQWDIYKVFDNVGQLVDSVVYRSEDGKIYLLSCEINPNDKHQTRLILFEIENFEDSPKIKLIKKWKQNEYSYSSRNGGILINSDGKKYRIAQQSTSKVYGKSVVINEIVSIGEEELQEKFIRKIETFNEKIDLPKYIYRKWGIHTYGCSGDFEIMDLSVQRFSVAGLWMKVMRRIMS